MQRKRRRVFLQISFSDRIETNDRFISTRVLISFHASMALWVPFQTPKGIKSPGHASHSHPENPRPASRFRPKSWHKLEDRFPASGKLTGTIHQLSTHAPAACLKMSRTREAPTPTKSSMNSEAEAWMGRKLGDSTRSFKPPAVADKQGRKTPARGSRSIQRHSLPKREKRDQSRVGVSHLVFLPIPQLHLLFALALRAKDIRQLNRAPNSTLQKASHQALMAWAPGRPVAATKHAKGIFKCPRIEAENDASHASPSGNKRTICTAICGQARGRRAVHQNYSA